MAGWLTSYTLAPKVTLEESIFEMRMSFAVPAGETPPTFARTCTQKKYMYTCLTEAAARSGVAAINNPPMIRAALRRGGDAGHYAIDVMETSYSAWAEQ